MLLEKNGETPRGGGEGETAIIGGNEGKLLGLRATASDAGHAFYVDSFPLQPLADGFGHLRRTGGIAVDADGVGAKGDFGPLLRGNGALQDHFEDSLGSGSGIMDESVNGISRGK